MLKPRALAGFLFCACTLAILLLAGCTTTSTTAFVKSLPPLPSRVVLSDVPFFPQRDYQCGPAALAMVLAYRQLAVTPDDLLDQVYLPERHGTLAPEMLAATRHYGRVPYMLAHNLRDVLLELAAGNPVLVMQNLSLSWYPQWHYSVLVGYDLDGAYLLSHSGPDAERMTSFRNFENTWRRADYWAMVIPSTETVPATARVLNWLQAAADLSATGHAAAAHRAYELASVTWPDQDLVWFALGNSFYQQQQFAESELAYRHALAIKPDNAETWNNLAYAMFAQGCHRAAMQAVDCALQHAPGDANILQSREELGSNTNLQSHAQCNKITCKQDEGKP